MITREERKAQNYIDYPASACGYLNSLTDKLYDDFEIEKDLLMKQAYIDGSNACHKAMMEARK